MNSLELTWQNVILPPPLLQPLEHMGPCWEGPASKLSCRTPFDWEAWDSHRRCSETAVVTSCSCDRPYSTKLGIKKYWLLCPPDFSSSCFFKPCKEGEIAASCPVASGRSLRLQQACRASEIHQAAAALVKMDQQMAGISFFLVRSRYSFEISRHRKRLPTVLPVA